MVPVSSATVSDPADFKTEKCAGPQMVMLPPSTRSMRACPDLTCTSLPLRSIVFICPWTDSTLIGPSTVMESPSIVPTESPEGGLSARTAGAPTSSAAKQPAAKRIPRIPRESAELVETANESTPQRARGQQPSYTI